MHSRIFFIISLIGILLMGTMPTAKASKLSASAEEDHVTLNIFASIYQNATSLPSRSFKLNRTAMSDVETRGRATATGDTITYRITPWYMTITGIASISLAAIVVAGGAVYLINRRRAVGQAI